MLDPTGSDGWKAFNFACWVLGGLSTAFASMCGYLALRLSNRVDTCVTREELKEFMKQQSEAAELRIKLQKQMHDQNTASLMQFQETTARGFEQLERKIDDHEAINASSRSSIGTSIQNMGLQIGILSERVGPRPLGFNSNR